MSGKENAKRKTAAREISVKVDGLEVQMNGFVMDVFQEVVVGLVRSLGDQNEEKKIELIIEEAPAK